MSSTIISLIGFMGSGKSTIGKKIANRWGYRFMDLDAYIEEKYEKSIPELFQIGEDYFRQIEQKCLDEVLNIDENTILSLGGGTPVFFDNMKKINEKSISIYLKNSPGLILQRLLQAEEARPLLTGKTQEELKTYIQSTIQDREQYYLQAKVIWDGASKSAQSVKELEEQLLQKGYILGA